MRIVQRLQRSREQPLHRLAKAVALLAAFALALSVTQKLNGGSLWEGLTPAIAAGNPAAEHPPAPYDLTQLKVVNEVLKTIRDRYVDPKRVKPKEMLLSALDFVQKDVAQVIVIRDEDDPVAGEGPRRHAGEGVPRRRRRRALGRELAHLREVFAFLQDGLRGTDVDLRDVEYAACNGMLHTLDPHSVLLSPEAYKEMNLSTQGQFGGLGIVISIRDQQLTVMNPMPDTPGRPRGPQEVRSHREDQQRVDAQHGPQRGRESPARRTRARRSPCGSTATAPTAGPGAQALRAHARGHPRRVGRAQAARRRHRLRSRSSSSRRTRRPTCEAALADMKKNGELKGLVLDLRGNPGGLLDQAAKVVDTFVNDGPIVATVGNPSEGREEKVAHGEGTEPNYPLAVLVNGSSASASEIVTGALKNHDRAVVDRRDDVRQGQRPARLHGPARQGGAQADDRAVPDRAGRRLHPGRRRDAGHRARPDDGRPARDGPDGRHRRRSRSAISRARCRTSAPRTAGARSRSSSTTCPSRTGSTMRERGGDLDENFELDFPIQFARGFVAHVQPGKRTDEVRQAQAVHRRHAPGRGRQGRRGAQGHRRRLERRSGRRPTAVADARAARRASR